MAGGTDDADWSGDWVYNEIAARVHRADHVSEDHRPGFVSPDMDWLINELAKLNKAGCSDAMIVRYAAHMLFDLNMLRIRGRSPANLRGNVRHGFTTSPRSTRSEGLANELQRLKRAARSGSMLRWLKAWAASTHKCREVIERSTLVPWAPLGNAVGIEGIFICPRPGIAIPAIEYAQRVLALHPARERQGNRVNDERAALIKAVRAAVRDLTGRVGVTYNRAAGTITGPLADFGSAFDARFTTSLRSSFIR